MLWFTLLMLVGNLYLLGVAKLNLTNLGAILIMLYMLIALVIGAACQICRTPCLRNGRTPYDATVRLPRFWLRCVCVDTQP